MLIEVNWSFCEVLGGCSSSADVRYMIMCRMDNLIFDGVDELV